MEGRPLEGSHREDWKNEARFVATDFQIGIKEESNPVNLEKGEEGVLPQGR
jgi:hypothetical protein